MRSKILVVLIAVAVMGVSSAAMAKGGGGKGGSGGHVGHFGHAHFDHRFLRNQFLLGGWGWDWGLGYGDNGYGNTTVVAFPQATPQAANVTGSIATGPCHWNADTFNVPSAAGGTRPVQVVGCR
jgi:opacity protein-like surface antigen